MLIALFIKHALCCDFLNNIYVKYHSKKAHEKSRKQCEPTTPKDMFPYFHMELVLPELKKYSKEKKVCKTDSKNYEVGEEMLQNYMAAFEATVSIYCDNTKLMLYAMQVQNQLRSNNIFKRLTTHSSYDELIDQDIIARIASTQSTAISNCKTISKSLAKYGFSTSQEINRDIHVLHTFQCGFYKFINSFIQNPKEHYKRFKAIFEETKHYYALVKKFPEFINIPDAKKEEIGKNIEEIDSLIQKVKQSKLFQIKNN